jgi:transcriptional regulator with XRE-family HTH domain
MTTTSLARRLGISPQRIYDWESGGKIPQRKHLPVLAEFLDLEIKDLALLCAAAKIDRKFRAGAASVETIHRTLVVAVEADADLRPIRSRRLASSGKV